ncbi:MAG: hypothetical protein A2Z14_01970 [Chloroflexi bacterium RBG_16_48_8]|nr:MAG: hypothetical protein A2Z14_01970 [Chloroflexi bacterium RBG_16_48_8]
MRVAQRKRSIMPGNHNKVLRKLKSSSISIPQKGKMKLTEIYLNYIEMEVFHFLVSCRMNEIAEERIIKTMGDFLRLQPQTSLPLPCRAQDQGIPTKIKKLIT